MKNKNPGSDYLPKKNEDYGFTNLTSLRTDRVARNPVPLDVSPSKRHKDAVMANAEIF